MKAAIVQKLLITAKERGIGGLHIHYNEDAPSHQAIGMVGDTSTITYLGVTQGSVVIEWEDGSRLRVINPNFLEGLKFEAHVNNVELVTADD